MPLFVKLSLCLNSSGSEVEHSAFDESLYCFVEGLGVQVRSARDCPVCDRPSLLDYISLVQALGQSSDGLQIRCTAFATQSGVYIQSCRALRQHG